MQTGTMSLAAVAMMMGMLMEGVWGHGMMMQPIQRSSMWRQRDMFPSVEANYNDNQLFCGGYQRQWETNGGKCGPCGDPYDEPRPRANEAGAKYGRGIIVQTYSQGQVIDVTIRITANHKGYFVFKLCPNNDVTTLVTHECLDRYALKAVGANGQLEDKFYIGSFVGEKQLLLQLPADVSCTHCVLQWTYNTGNNWDCFPNNTCCLGCGPQENFVNCADIAISPSDDTDTNSPVTNVPSTTSNPVPTTTTINQPTSTTTTTQPTTTASTTTTTTTTKSTTTTAQPNQPGSGCVGVPPYDGIPGIAWWCDLNCVRGFCPLSHCLCG